MTTEETSTHVPLFAKGFRPSLAILSGIAPNAPKSALDYFAALDDRVVRVRGVLLAVAELHARAKALTACFEMLLARGVPEDRVPSEQEYLGAQAQHVSAVASVTYEYSKLLPVPR